MSQRAAPVGPSAAANDVSVVPRSALAPAREIAPRPSPTSATPPSGATERSRTAVIVPDEVRAQLVSPLAPESTAT